MPFLRRETERGNLGEALSLSLSLYLNRFLKDTGERRKDLKYKETWGAMGYYCLNVKSLCRSAAVGCFFERIENMGASEFFESVLWNALGFRQIYLLSNLTIGIRLEKLPCYWRLIFTLTIWWHLGTWFLGNWCWCLLNLALGPANFKLELGSTIFMNKLHPTYQIDIYYLLLQPFMPQSCVEI